MGGFVHGFLGGAKRGKPDIFQALETKNGRKHELCYTDKIAAYIKLGVMRAKALSCVIRNCQELLKLRPESVPIYTDGQSYDITWSKIIVIHSSRIPTVVSTYERYDEPGNPVISHDYRSLESFVFGLFEVSIARVANQLAREETGFPFSKSSDYSKEKMDNFLQLRNEIEKLLRQGIKVRLSEQKSLVVERFVWRTNAAQPIIPPDAA